MKRKTYASLMLASSLLFSAIPAFAADQESSERVGEAKPAVPHALLAPASGQLQTTSLSSSLTPEQLVESLLGGGVTVQNVVFKGANAAAGQFTGGDGIIGFNEGIILSSGDIANVKGPNQASNITKDNGKPGDSDLNNLVQGTQDAATLEFDFIPEHDVISFQYVFASDEYNEFVGSQYNDVFGFFINGQNMALIPNTTTPVSINNVNNGYGSYPAHNSEYYIDNDQSTGHVHLNTEMDGLTKVLSVEAPVNKGQVNHIKLAIADVHDAFFDSNVFIKAGSFTDKPVDSPPVVTASADRQPNANGWYNSDVTVSFTAEDADSTPVASVDPPVTVSSEGKDQVISGSAVDTAGLTGSGSITLNIDKTAPQTEADVTGTTNGSGWYSSDTDITLAASDNLSGVAETEYSLDGGATWQSYSGPIHVTDEGQNTIEYRSVDKADNAESIESIQVNIDKTAPTLNLSVNNDVLWPPNHKLVPIKVNVDNDDNGSGVASVVLDSVTSNEPDDGLGDGDTANDIQEAEAGTPDTSFKLRAERSGEGTGRVYTITYTVTDTAGNTTTQSVTVTVPHDQKK